MGDKVTRVQARGRGREAALFKEEEGDHELVSANPPLLPRCGLD